MRVGDRSDSARALKIAQPVERKNDVPIFLEPGAVEIYRDVADQQISRTRIGRDRPVIGVAAAERVFAAQHQTRRTHDRDPAL